MCHCMWITRGTKITLMLLILVPIELNGIQKEGVQKKHEIIYI